MSTSENLFSCDSRLIVDDLLRQDENTFVFIIIKIIEDIRIRCQIPCSYPKRYLAEWLVLYTFFINVMHIWGKDKIQGL